MTPYEKLLKEATPLPWMAEDDTDERDRPCVCINALPDNAIADICGRGDYLPRAKADGKLIEHSTNVLPQALEALKHYAPGHVSNCGCVACSAIAAIENVK